MRRGREMKTSVKRRAKNCIRGAVLLACFIAVWYVASCFTQPLFIPAPATVWEAIVGLAETGQLQKGLAYSFLRITGASALSMLVAIPLSLLIYGVKPIKETIMPVVSFLRYVPVTAFSPLLILWFGIGEQMKISFLFIATFVYLLPSILLCFNDVPQDLMDTGKTIGMTSWETIKEILLPASLPSIFSTFLMMYGIGWTYCAVVEATNAISRAISTTRTRSSRSKRISTFCPRI
jgi:NitT/TauT family transport system permease protein